MNTKSPEDHAHSLWLRPENVAARGWRLPINHDQQAVYAAFIRQFSKAVRDAQHDTCS